MAFLFSLFYYIVLLPWQVKWLPITLGIMLTGLFWLLETGFKLKFKLLGANPYAWLLFLSYGFVFLGSLYSSEPNQAHKELFSKIPLIVWPLLLGSNRMYQEKTMRQIFRLFIFSAVLLVIASFSFAIYRYLQTASGEVFYFSELLVLSKVPPHYLGMYVTFAYALVLYHLLKGSPFFKASWTNIIILVLLALAVIFIWVRMQYLLFIIVNAYILVQYLKAKRGLKVALASLASLVVAFSLLLVAIPGSRSRLVDTYHELRSFEQMIENKQTNPRKFLWREGFKVIGENFWWGVGTGSENTALNQKLEKVDAIFWDGSQTYQLHEMKFNYHNSFLQVFAANGIFAFLIFVAILILPFFGSAHHPYRTELRIFLILSILSFFTESMLQRQAGVLFFSLFYSVLVLMPYPETRINKRQAKEGIDTTFAE